LGNVQFPGTHGKKRGGKVTKKNKRKNREIYPRSAVMIKKGLKGPQYDSQYNSRCVLEMGVNKGKAL